MLPLETKGSIDLDYQEEFKSGESLVSTQLVMDMGEFDLIEDYVTTSNVKLQNKLSIRQSFSVKFL